MEVEIMFPSYHSRHSAIHAHKTMRKTICVNFRVFCSFAQLFFFCGHVSAQDYTPQPDRFASVKDRKLRETLNRFSDGYTYGDRQKIIGSNKQEEIWKIFTQPQMAQDISFILDSISSLDFEHEKLVVRVTVLEVLEAAVISGQENYVVALKRLARHTSPDIRSELSRSIAYSIAPTPQLSVMVESLLAAEERLPRNLHDIKAARESVEEFSSIVESYCCITTAEQRRDIEPIVNRVLATFDVGDFQSYYRPRLIRAMSTPIRKTPLRASSQLPSNAEFELGNTSNDHSHFVPAPFTGSHKIKYAWIAVITTFGACWLYWFSRKGANK